MKHWYSDTRLLKLKVMTAELYKLVKIKIYFLLIYKIFYSTFASFLSHCPSCYTPRFPFSWTRVSISRRRIVFTKYLTFLRGDIYWERGRNTLATRRSRKHGPQCIHLPVEWRFIAMPKRAGRSRMKVGWGKVRVVLQQSTLLPKR